MKKNKTYKVDFYRIILKDDNNVSHSLFKILTNKEYQVISIGDDEYKVTIKDKNKDFLKGEIRKYRNKNDKPIIVQRGNNSPDIDSLLPLNADEFLTDWNQFILTKRDVLIYQVNKNGAYISKFIDYWKKALSYQYNLDIVRLIKKGALQKILSGVYEYRRYEIKVSVPENPEFYNTEYFGDLLSDALISLKKMSPSSQSVKLSVSSEHKKLPLENISTVVQDLLKKWGSRTEKAYFHSKDPNGSVDLVEDFLRSQFDIAPDENLEHLRAVIFDRMLDVYNSNKTDIDEIL